MGLDAYDNEAQLKSWASRGLPRMGIGHDTYIEKAIVDKNARIGDNCRITPEGKPSNMDGENFYIRDGIVVIPKNAILPPGTWI